MNAEQLLDLLEKRELLASSLVRNLRSQVEGSRGAVTPQRVLKLLVDKGHLTEFQAKKLLAEVAAAKSAQADPPAAASPPKPADDLDLGLAPIDEDAQQLKPLPADDDLGLAPLDEDKPAPQKPTTQKPTTPTRPAAGAAKPQQQRPAKTWKRRLPKTTPPQERTTPRQRPTKQPTKQPTSQPAQPRKTTEGAAPKQATEGTSPATTPVGKSDRSASAAAEASTAPPSSGSAGVSPGGPAPLSDGLHELLGEDDLGADDLSSGSALLPAKPSKTGLFGSLTGLGKDRRTKAGTWDSPLILMGGGTLIVLLLVGVVLFVFLSRGSGDKIFQEAEESYREQAYRQAIHTYEKFLARNATHANASLARVRRGLAQLRLATEGGANPEQALTEANRVLPAIVKEEAFDEAYSELASILPGIAEGFAEKARVATETDVARNWLALTNKALALVDNPSYLPTSARQGVQGRIESIQETVEQVQNLIRRDERLAETIQVIQAAVAQSDTQAAYQAHTSLLNEYPGLAQAAELGEAVQSITEKMGEKVNVGPSSAAALAGDRPRPLGKVVVLAARQGQTAAALANQVLLLMVEGAVYGVQAEDGTVLWRRFVGFHPGTRLRLIDNESQGDALLLDGRHQELQRLARNSGELVWRLPLESPAFAVQRTAEHLVVAEESGRILLVDPSSGAARLQAVLPQKIATTVGVAEDENALLVVGDHSNLYVLAADTLACRDVVYLGHKADCVRAAPIACLSHILVVENSGIDFAQVHVLAPAAHAHWQTAQKPLRISDNVVVDPLTNAPHVICLTDRGGVYVFEVNPSDTKQPANEVAKAGGGTQDIVAGSMLYEDKYLWVADVQLTRYRVNTSLGQIERVWANHQGDTFLTWLERRGAFVFHARQPRGSAGVTLSALRMGGAAGDRAIEPLWTTDIGVAPSGPPLVDEAARRLLAVSVRGNAHQIDATALQTGISSQTVFRLGRTLPAFHAPHQTDIGNGRRVFAASDGPPRWLLFDASAAAAPFKQVRLDVKDTQMMTAPQAFRDGVLLTLDNGQVHLADPASGEQAAFPFQPPLNAERSIVWQPPGVLEDGNEFVLADGDGNLYRIGLDAGTRPQLKARSQGRASGPIVSPTAALGKSVFAVIQQGDNQVLCQFDLQEFETTGTSDLAGRATLGPVRVGQTVFLATDQDGLLAVNETGQTTWRVPLAGAVPAGPPVPVDDGWFLATTDGVLRRIGGDETVVVELDTGEPIAAGPLVQGNNLLVSGVDGTVRMLPLPAGT